MTAALVAAQLPASAWAGSLAFFENGPNDHDYGLQTTIPPGFGDGEFTLELWIKPDNSYPVGPTTFGTPGQLVNWSNSDSAPYSFCGGSACWWWEGNFLLDGHNNNTFQNGTFSLQYYAGGRLRWDFGDGVSAGPGGHWAVEAFPGSTTSTLLDGSWHQVTLVRRWQGVSEADLELWIDGTLVATETSSARTNMATSYWNFWSGFPSGQQGWFWGAEKQAAIGVLSQYEDHKGLVDEVRFWSRAKTASEIITDWDQPVDGTEPGLVGLYHFDEGTGSTTCDALALTRCINLINMKTGDWDGENAPPECLIEEQVTISNMVLNGIETHEACKVLTVGPSITVTGEVTFRAGNKVVFVPPVTLETNSTMDVLIGLPFP